MGKRKTLEQRAIVFAKQYGDGLTFEAREVLRRGLREGFRKGHRANRISAAERRVVEAALLAAKHCRKYGTVPLDELMAAVEKLERAKGGANG